jgi:hypothetical protein
MKDLTRNLVTAVIKGDKVASAAAFDTVIKEKLNAALDAHKASVANVIFNKTS